MRLSTIVALTLFLFTLGCSGIAQPKLVRSECISGDRLVTGRVTGLPQNSERQQRFVFELESVHTLQGEELACFGLVRVAWYRAPVQVQTGERWHFTLRLREPRGLANPGGFDYVSWLKGQGIVATAYVRKQPAPQRLSSPSSRSIDAVRATIGKQLMALEPERASLSLLKGLAVGDRQGISAHQWRVLSRTGTSHLMAISGLHIALVAGAVYFIAGWLWRRSPLCISSLPVPYAAAALAWVIALLYAAMAGFGVPTQRALLMFALALLLPLLGRPIALGWILALAGLLMVILEPAISTQAGFWLSFGAVGLILLTYVGRFPTNSLWWRFGRIHLLLAIGLTPLLSLYFHQIPVISPVANLIAVPWMGGIVIPLALIGTLLLYLGLPGAEQLLLLCAEFLEWLWLILEWLAELVEPFIVAAHGPLILSLAGIGVVWLLGPWPFRLKLPAGLLLLPLLLKSPPIAQGAVAITMLDVGQALALVIRTREHTLVYDTGAAYSPGFEAGSGIIAPFLRRLGIERIDRLVVSHAGADHSGGVPGLLRALPVTSKLTSQPESARLEGFEQCRAGQQWRWDGVEFRILYPSSADDSLNDNNRSCVLQVRSAQGESLLLLTGDLEVEGEERLLRRYAGELQSQIVQVPHHGSKTSSHPAFVDAVEARFALVSSGYHNRYHFPMPEVVARYRQRGSVVLNSAVQGAVELNYSPQSGLSEPVTQRH